ncbi:hypothetical protein AMK26_19565 [Streptomyces sp. CB03234]|uniref:YqjF family protein n=1 Tax=Streptomyces sp. (strain CB03234) TaxID=1703937 RepID=UPI00095E7808|nr:hypothetical protein AMK26_19565 [Streptomyces sp. CB03234]
MLTARWLSQSFVHWAHAPEEVQALLPDGLEVDLFQDAAWVGFTPFVMDSVKAFGALPVPGPAFFETNLRTYVRLPSGKDGLWFLSIEVGNPLMLAARVIGVPYHLGDLEVAKDGPLVRYAGVRRGGAPRPSYRLTVRVGDRVAEPTERDVWLTSRWRAVTRRAGALWETPVEHEPWPLARATVLELEESLTARAGLTPPAGDPVVHFSPGVGPVRLGVTRPV